MDTNNPYGAGPSSRPMKTVSIVHSSSNKPPRPKARPAPVIIITDSEPEICDLVDSSDSDDVEILGIRLAGTARPNFAPSATTGRPSHLKCTLAERTGRRIVTKPALARPTPARPTTVYPTPLICTPNLPELKQTGQDIIDADDDIYIVDDLLPIDVDQWNQDGSSHSAPNVSSIGQHPGHDSDSDSDSIPEGFEPWEPTIPIDRIRRAPAPKAEENNQGNPILAWSKPKMDWFREDCTGASSAGAFIEPEARSHGRSRPQIPSLDLSYVDQSSTKRPRWIRERSRFGPAMRAVAEREADVLNSGFMVPIPGMNAPRGAVNCIAQSKGYIAVGRTYQEDAAYDGGGLAVWSVAKTTAEDLPAHIVTCNGPNDRRSSAEFDPEKKQKSIVALSFDPQDHTSLLSAGQDDNVFLWSIDEETGAVTEKGKHRVRKAGCISFSPEGRFVAIGRTAGFQVLDTANQLKQQTKWEWKRGGHEVVNIIWGVNRSRRMIAAATQDDEYVKGRLVVFDSEAQRAFGGVNAESCSSLSLDPSGTVLAFTGSGRGGNPRRHLLRLYDALRTDWRPTASIGIPSSKTGTNGEVVEVAWSPNGIHLACARDDNTVDLFDTRWLGQRHSMIVFKHDTDTNTGGGENDEMYGVQGVAWFGSNKLVSGGGDHCVRIWDITRDEECRVLARLDGPVGYLVGSEDPELFPVVAGDLLGNTYYLPNRQLVS